MTDNVLAARAPRFGIDRNAPVARFWRWWSGELAALTPQWLGQSGANAATSLLVEINPQYIILHRRLQGILTEQGRLELQADDSGVNDIAVQTLFTRVRKSGEQVALLLSGAQFLARRIELPLAALENLRQVLSFEMDRHTPFKADQVYFGFRPVQQDKTCNRIAVNLIVAPRTVVNGCVEQLARWGIAVPAVYVADPEQGEDGNINLMPNDQRAAESSGLGRLNLALFFLVLVLALAAILIPVWQKHQALIELIPRVDRAKEQAVATEALRHEQEILATEFNLMLNKKQEFTPVIVVLDELSSLLPDDTWVQQFNLRGKELQVQGETASSSKLINLIESSRIFHNSGFRSPLTKGSTPNSERFQLVAEVKPLTVAALKSWPLFPSQTSESTGHDDAAQHPQLAVAPGDKSTTPMPVESGTLQPGRRQSSLTQPGYATPSAAPYDARRNASTGATAP